jgi:HK97 family phage portal protein
MAGEVISRRSLFERIGAAVAAFKAMQPAVSGGLRWMWPGGAGGSSGWWGNGDRGPLGAWQMNMNGPHTGIELLAFSAVYACVNTIAADIAKLPLQVFEIDMETGARELRRQDYYAQLFRRPNEYQTSSDLVLGFVQSYLLQGNAYAYIGKRNRRGEPEEIHLLNPYRTTPLIAENGTIFYRVGGPELLAGLEPDAIIPERDIIHHRLPLLPGFPMVGVTPIFAAAASSAVGIRILQSSQDFFGNAARPSGVLESDRNVGDDAADRLKKEWDAAYRGREFGKVALLPWGVKWTPLTITAQDAELIQQLRWSVEDVARVFRVPPFMLGDMTKVSYRNNEQLVRAYVTGCLGSHIEALEQRFSLAFNFEQRFEIKFDLSAAMRTEIDVRYAAYTQALTAGFKSINEVRALEGDKPVEGGEEPRVQMQYVPLSQATEEADPQDPPATPAPPPGAPIPPPPEQEQPQPAPAETQSESIDPARVRSLVRRRLAMGAAR